jgi:hypothetical protein
MNEGTIGIQSVDITKWIVSGMPLELDNNFDQRRVCCHIVVRGGWVYRDVRLYLEWKTTSCIAVVECGRIDEFEVMNVLPQHRILKSNDSCEKMKENSFEGLTKGSYAYGSYSAFTASS